jgi:hypothetical protein
MGAFSFSDDDDSNTKHAGIFTGTSDPQMSAWDIEFSIQRGVPWFNLDKLGETSLFGSISNIHNGLGAGTGLGRIGPNRFLPAAPSTTLPWVPRSPAPTSIAGRLASIRRSTRPICTSTRSISTSPPM